MIELAIQAALALLAGIAGAGAMRFFSRRREPPAPNISPEDTIRHAHNFNKRTEDGIYLCKCGDRYLDGKPPKWMK